MEKDAGTAVTETTANESVTEKTKLTRWDWLAIFAALAIVSIPIFGIEL